MLSTVLVYIPMIYCFISRQRRDFDFVYPAANSSRRQTSNRKIVLGALAFMLIGGAVEYFIIR